MDPKDVEPPSAVHDDAIQAFHADLKLVARGETLRGLARQMSYSRASVAELLSQGRRRLPPWDLVEQFLRACGVSAEDIERHWRSRWWELFALESGYSSYGTVVYDGPGGVPIRRTYFTYGPTRNRAQAFGRQMSRVPDLAEAGENLLEAVLVVLRQAAQAPTEGGQGDLGDDAS